MKDSDWWWFSSLSLLSPSFFLASPPFPYLYINFISCSICVLYFIYINILFKLEIPNEVKQLETRQYFLGIQNTHTSCAHCNHFFMFYYFSINKQTNKHPRADMHLFFIFSSYALYMFDSRRCSFSIFSNI